MSLRKKYSGVVVPMITPFREDQTIDLEAVDRIVDSFVEAGVSPFLLGTTGEAPSISSKQKEVLVKAVINRVNGKELVYAGISSNCLSDSIEDAKKYGELGVDVVVATLPAYYPMNNDQMLKYFTQLADKVTCPLIIYNMPATVKYSIPLEVIEKLSHHPNIVGLKDSERDVERLEHAIKMSKDRDDFAHLIGWAARSAFALQAGSDGIVPSTGNITPELYRELYDAALAGNMTQAWELQKKTDYISSLYQKDRILSESIPALKAMMSVAGLCGPQVLPPMYCMEPIEEERYMVQMKKELQNLNLVIKL